MGTFLDFLKSNSVQPRADIAGIIRRGYLEDPDLFHRLFVFLKSVPESCFHHCSWFRDALIETGILIATAGVIRASIMIVPLKHRLIATDLPSDEQPSAIFPIYPETLYLIDQIPDHAMSILDIGTGSGVLSIFASEKSPIVTPVDINDRALLFTQFNAVLNGVGNKIFGQKTNLLSSLAGNYYDCILANLPFEPVPPGYSYYLHSDGGTDGLKLISEFLSQINDEVIKFGQIRMVAFSLGNDKHMIIEDVLRKKLGNSHFGIEVEILAKPLKFTEFAKRFESAPQYKPWLTSTLQNGLQSLFFIGVKIVPSRTFYWSVSRNSSRHWGAWENPVNWNEYLQLAP